MDLDVITKYIARATIRTIVYVRDDNKALVVPTSVFVTLTDANGLKVADQENIIDSGKMVDGIYQHLYRTSISSPKGTWQGLVEVIDGAGGTAVNSPVSFSIEVI